jgi:2-methylcitrate dehydratase PrpD
LSHTPEHRLAAHAVNLKRTELDESVRHAARRCVLDWCAATVPGGIAPPAHMLAQALDEEVGHGHGKASLIPSGTPATTRAAALINGTAAHTVEFDDIYRPAIYHPGAPVISAALAMAERFDATGEQLLRAIVAGYEVSNRVGAALVPAHYTYWHTTGTAGTLGAAIASGVIAGLDEQAMHHALGNATTMAAGLQQAFRSDAMTKPIHAGRAAEAGVLCALAAAHGFTGALGMLSGERGLGNAMSNGPAWDEALEDLERDFTITRMTQKNHGCCGHTFAAIDAVIALRAEHNIEARQIKSIAVRTYRTALEVTGDWQPTTPYQAKFSLPFVVSTALIHGAVRLAAFDAERLGNTDIRELMQRVTIDVDEEMDAAFPDRRAASVSIERHDGKCFSHYAPTRKGDPDAPLSDDELNQKFHELVDPVVGSDEAQRVRDTIWSLDQLVNCTVLVPRRDMSAAAQ